MSQEDSDKILTDMSFGEALERFAKIESRQVTSAITTSSMKDGDIDRLISTFESFGHKDEAGLEYWYARDLQRLLDYAKWENFESTLKRAMIACERSGQRVTGHWLPEVRNPISGKGKIEEVSDFRMTRYACYLTAQNADSKKTPVAFAQTYFAIQTRRQELSDSGSTSEDEKRIFLRGQIKEHNRYLSSAAHNAGVVTPQEFAIFHSHGYQGLYGKTVPEIRLHKGLKPSEDILDRMGSTELAANFFRVTQTEEKLRKEGIQGTSKAYRTHFAVGRQVRMAMLQISGIAPENLPVADNIKQAEKRLKIDRASAPPATPFPPIPAPMTIADSSNEPPMFADNPVDLRTDLWKYALLIMATRPDGVIPTSDLIAEFPNYIRVPEEASETLSSRGDSKFSQLVRNLKSHRNFKTNFIYQGFAKDVPGGFQITAKGMEFVEAYFA